MLQQYVCMCMMCMYVYIRVHVCMCRCMCVRICMHVAYWFEISSADQEVLGSVLNRCYYNLTNVAPLHQGELVEATYNFEV